MKNDTNLDFHDTFDTDGEDSTDEEKQNAAVNQYDLMEQWKSFTSRTADIFELKTVDPKSYSFYAYAKGLQILYSPEVNELYYKKKKQLEKPRIHTTDKDLINWVNDAITKAIADCTNFHYDHNFLREIVNRSFQDLDDKLFESISRNRVLYSQYANDDLLPEMHNFINTILNEFKICINELEDSDLPNKTSGFDIIQLSQDTVWQIIVRSKVTEHLRSIGFLSADDKLKPKADRLRIFKNTIANNEFERAVLTAFASINCNQYHDILNNNIANFSLQHLSMLINQKCQAPNPILIKDQTKPFSYTFTAYTDNDTDFQHAFFSRKTCQQYFPKSPAFVKAELNSQFDLQFTRLFKNYLIRLRPEYNIDWERGTLPQPYQFTSTSLVDYLANLRLSYRDQKRTVKQLENDDFSINDDALKNGKTFLRTWKFGNIPEVAAENLEVTIHKAKRDIVLDLPNYDGIYDKIIKIIQHINNPLITNADIAHWVFHILLHKPEDNLFTDKNGNTISLSRPEKSNIRQILVNLTHLLFGCEIIRNPAGLVTQLLILHKIANENYSWQRAIAQKEHVTPLSQHPFFRKIKFGGGEIPMTMGSYKEDNQEANAEHTKKSKKNKKKSEPALCARALQIEYNPRSIHAYFYPGQAAAKKKKAEIQELVRREKNVVETSLARFDGNTEEEKLLEMDRSISSFYLDAKG